MKKILIITALLLFVAILWRNRRKSTTIPEEFEQEFKEEPVLPEVLEFEENAREKNGSDRIRLRLFGKNIAQLNLPEGIIPSPVDSDAILNVVDIQGDYSRSEIKERVAKIADVLRWIRTLSVNDNNNELFANILAAGLSPKEWEWANRYFMEVMTGEGLAPRLSRYASWAPNDYKDSYYDLLDFINEQIDLADPDRVDRVIDSSFILIPPARPSVVDNSYFIVQE